MPLPCSVTTFTFIVFLYVHIPFYGLKAFIPIWKTQPIFIV